MISFNKDSLTHPVRQAGSEYREEQQEPIDMIAREGSFHPRRVVV